MLFQGNRLRKSPDFNNRQSIRERPGTTLAFAGQRILDGSIGFEHLHTKLTEHIDNDSCMPQGDMDIIFMETTVKAPMEFVFNTPMLPLKRKKPFCGHFLVAEQKVMKYTADFPCIQHRGAYSNISVKSVADCDKIERSQEAEYGQEEKQRTERRETEHHRATHRDVPVIGNMSTSWNIS